MKRLSFKTQGFLSLAVIICTFASEWIFKMDLFHNIGWILVGLLFAINPVWPKAWDWRDHDDLGKGICIGSILVIIVFGFLTRYGA